MTQPVEFQVWFDVQCVWCYIGDTRVHDAVRQFDGRVNIQYRTFELQPDAPIDFDAGEYLRTQRGMSVDEKNLTIGHITRVAAFEGLTYDFEHIKPTNSTKAHQLLHYAKARGHQADMVKQLFQAYFANGEHVGRVDDLANLAAGLGFDRGDVVRSLEAEEYLAATMADSAEAASYGVRAAPFYIVDGKYGLSGAQSVASFLQVINKARDERERASLVAPLAVVGDASAVVCAGNVCILPQPSPIPTSSPT